MSKAIKIISAAVLVVILATIYVASNQEIMAKITGAKTGNMPIITNAFLDKTKYLPGDQMLITAETKNASSVKAFIENEKGYNEIDLVMTIKNNGKETWMGQWKVSNSLDGKEYNLKITAYNKSGSAEKMLTWIDPNPGHSWNQMDCDNNLCVDTTTNKTGIGTMSPEEKLTVSGAVKIGTTGSANPGTIRWTGTNFEGYNGTNWINLTSGSKLPVTITSSNVNNPNNAADGDFNTFASIPYTSADRWIKFDLGTVENYKVFMKYQYSSSG
jgi:hypothetical protein